MKQTLILVLTVMFCSAAEIRARPTLNPPDNSVIKDFNEQESLELAEPDEPVASPVSTVPAETNYDELESPVQSVLENRPDNTSFEDAFTEGSTELEPANHFAVSSELNQLFTRIVLEHLPHQYVQDKKWGKQIKRWAGVEFRRDDDHSRLETKRRYKMVNHGTWKKYSAELVDPNNQFSVELGDLSRTDAGLTVFDVSFAADLIIEARQSKWVKGVQLYSLSANGSARVRLKISCDLAVELDLSRFPPDLVFSPTVTNAQIKVDEFELDRISKLGGEFAQQASRRARKELDEKIHEKEQKLVKKLNKEIEDNREKLRLSIADAIHLKWYGQAREFLPGDVQDAIAGSAASEQPKN